MIISYIVNFFIAAHMVEAAIDARRKTQRRENFDFFNELRLIKGLRENYCPVVKTVSVAKLRPSNVRTDIQTAALNSELEGIPQTFVSIEEAQLSSVSPSALMLIDSSIVRIPESRQPFSCSSREFFPKLRDFRLRPYDAMSCHTICRSCFPGSLAVCMRRNLDNKLGSTCYCTYDALRPIENYAFKLTDG